MAHTRKNDSGRVRPKNEPYKRERFNNKSWINHSVAIKSNNKAKEQPDTFIQEELTMEEDDTTLMDVLYLEEDTDHNA